jgi:excisionase family DNA binding protein
MPKQLLTVRQVAECLAVTENKVRSLCQRGSKGGGLEALKIDSQWRIPQDEVTKFIEYKTRG